MVTPLTDQDTLDNEGVQNVVEHILKGGVHGLFILGSTGEAPGLSHRLQRELVKRVTEQVGNRVPVMVGISDTSFVHSVNLAEHAHECGASAVVVAPPYYFPAGQPELIEYIRHLTEKLTLPLFLYNMPRYTKLSFEPDTVRELAGITGIAGLKDSSGSMMYFHRLQYLLQDNPDFSLLVGPEELLGEAVLLGAHGGICGGANLWPELYVDLYKAASAGEHGKVAELHAQVMKLSNTLYSIGRHPSSYLKGLKCALNCIGICSDFMVEPFHKFREPEREEVRKTLKETGFL